MTATHAPPVPYSSLDALRRANDELIANLPEDDSRSRETESLAEEARTTEFLRRAVETGAVLDTPADRNVAQGLIDYWVATAHTASGDRGTKRPLSGRADTLLKPFDATAMRSTAERSDAAVRALDRKDQALARRILLRLLRFSHGTCVSAPTIRDALFSPGDAGRGNAIVEGLHEAGALVVTPTARGDLVELRYEALVRQWERLHDWIDERTKFRDAALFWVRSGKNRGALVSRRLAKSATEYYGDLDDLEREFIDESRTRARQRLMVLLAAAVALIVVVPPLAKWAYETFYIRPEAERMLQTARSSVHGEDRQKSIRWLTEHQQKLSLSRASFVDLDLTRIRALPQSNFIEATLQKVDLTEAALPAAQFSQSHIADSRFDHADLGNARFDEALISNTSFSGADLGRSLFDRARLCNVDLSGADVSEASFRDITYDASDPPKFTETAWWLAAGWNLQQVDLFTDKFGGSDRKIGVYMKEFGRFESMLKANPHATMERAKALDGKAWTRAIYGIDLEEAAEDAQRALTIVEALKSTPGGVSEKMQSYIADTRGYVLMQGRQSKTESALPLLKTAARGTENPGAVFRYALALHMLGDEDEAVENLTRSVDEMGYSPSHELLLLRRYFSGRFMTTFAELTEKRRQTTGDQPQSGASPRRPCPTPQK
jgi:uncharacterized protein YjbI with pentapeptide repeats